ncbi:hypothetical protein Kisp02_43150 [Kineosporia sp. NBRC 101731]|nr:hypothetical protein Kisp02_43150 [Kineosporia sp. NBRC 101731]
MHRAVDQKNTAGRRAASRVRDAISDDGLRDSWWDKVKNWSGQTWNSFTQWVHDNAKLFQDITKWAGRISTLLTVIGTICAVIPILNVAAPAFFALAAVATAVSFVFNVMLALSGDGSWLDVGMDAIALATFGYGRYATAGVKAASQGLKGAARTAAAEGLVKEGAAGLRDLGEQAVRTGTRLGPEIWQTARRTVYEMADEGADDLVKGVMTQAEGSAGLLKFADTRVGKLLGMDSEVALAADKVKALAGLAPGSASVQKAVEVAEDALKVKKRSDGIAAVGNKLPAAVELIDKKFEIKKYFTWGRYATQ